MKIDLIKTDRVFSPKEPLLIEKMVCTIEFDLSGTETKPDGNALYYLICALDKCNGKPIRNLDLLEQIEVQGRLDSAINKLIEMQKELYKIKDI